MLSGMDVRAFIFELNLLYTGTFETSNREGKLE